ncbi:MAG: NUDIX hydrolase [Bacteroidota bacterium]
MSLRPWKKLSEQTLFDNPWWSYRRDLCELPSGKPGEYHYVHTNGSSMVIPVADDGRILLVKQFRYLLARESMEFPCGSRKDGSSYDATARQELTEETGFAAGELLRVGEYNPYNGVTDEICRVYVARRLRETGGTPDETEEFELMRLWPGEIDEKVSDGTIWDGMTIAAWAIARGGEFPASAPAGK